MLLIVVRPLQYLSDMQEASSSLCNASETRAMRRLFWARCLAASELIAAELRGRRAASSGPSWPKVKPRQGHGRFRQDVGS